MLRCLAILFLAPLFLAGCSENFHILSKTPENSYNNKIRRISLDVYGSYSSGGYVVKETRNSDLRPGDMITSIGQKEITKASDVKSAISKYGRANSPLEVSIKRNGSIETRKVRLVTIEEYPTIDALQTLLLYKKNNIVLAVVFGKYAVPPRGDDAARRSAVSIGERETAVAESLVRDALAATGRIRMADKVKTAQIVNIHKFHETGYVSPEMRADLANMTGATHLLVADYSTRISERKNYIDERRRRLVDIETGDVEAIDIDIAPHTPL